VTDLHLLAVGAHPDDIEIGAGALLARAADLGLETYFLILTDHDADRDVRRAEAIQAAKVLGVPGDHIVFAGLRDGRLRADARSVGRVRKLVAARKLTPGLIVTHTTADSHNDHVEANRIAHAAFRGCAFLHFSTYLSREQEPFAPRVFVSVAGEPLERKLQALARHDSQAARLERRDLAAYEAGLGKLAGLARAEAFEVSLQEGASGPVGQILELSESPFHRLWAPVVGRRDITLFYEAYTMPGAPIDWPTNDENTGRDRLRQAFRDQWLPASPLCEAPSSSPDAYQVLRSQSVILAGGAVSNLIVRDLYNRFRSTRWAVEYEMPRQEPAYLYNRSTGARHYPEYSGVTPRRDFGVLAKVASPYAADRRVVCAGGASGLGTRAALEFLADPASDPAVARILERPGNIQIAFSVAGETGKLEIVDECHDEPS
jgi:LmbE family N-acetylglucosaminyl deacetylase